MVQPPNQAASGQPTITGTAEVGETLAAGTSGITDGNGLSDVQYAYQWIGSSSGTDTDISGATGSTYILTADDLADTIKVRVSFTDDDGYSESLTSNATDPVIPPPNQTANGQPAITGTVEVGETLTADTSGITDGNGLSNPQYTHQWVHSVDGSDTDIPGATGSTYTSISADAGNAFKLRVGFTDDDGYSETLTSQATDILLVAQQQGATSSVSEPEGQDFPANKDTAGRVALGVHGATGYLSTTDTGTFGDGFQIELLEERRYRVDVLVDAYHDIGHGGTYPDKPLLEILGENGGIGVTPRVNGYGDYVPFPLDEGPNYAANKGSGPDNAARSEFSVMTTGTHVISIRGDGSATGTYTVRAWDITSEDAYGDFTSGFAGGRLKIDDAEPMTGVVNRTGDYDWYLALLEEGKCYTFHAKGEHSNADYDGGTLNDPKIKLMKFYDYYEKQYYDPDTRLYERPDPLTMAYFETVYIDPAEFVNMSGSDEQCFTFTENSTSKEFCNYYCDDNGGQGNNSRLQVKVAAGGGGEYLLSVFAADVSTGSYSLFVEETTCPN